MCELLMWVDVASLFLSWLGVGGFMGMADKHWAYGRAGGMEESWL